MIHWELQNYLLNPEMPRQYIGRCQAITEYGTQCKRRAEVMGPCEIPVCWQHCDMSQLGEELEFVDEAEPMQCKAVCDGEYQRGFEAGRSQNVAAHNSLPHDHLNQSVDQLVSNPNPALPPLI